MTAVELPGAIPVELLAVPKFLRFSSRVVPTKTVPKLWRVQHGWDAPGFLPSAGVGHWFGQDEPSLAKWFQERCSPDPSDDASLFSV